MKSLTDRRAAAASLYTQITSKGQIVIPAELREQMKLEPGTRVAVRREGTAIVLQPITKEFIRSFIGITKGAGDERERTHRDDKER
jgi:AbrB family looped-hinge helix DNA binding protein